MGAVFSVLISSEAAAEVDALSGIIGGDVVICSDIPNCFPLYIKL